MLRLNLTESAQDDFEKIEDYSLSNWGKQQTNDYLDKFEKVFHLLLDNPWLGKAREDIMPGCRALSVEKHNVFYYVTEQTIDVLRILHVSMDVTQRLF